MALPPRRYLRDDGFDVFLTANDILPAFSAPNPPLPVSVGGTGDTGTAWTTYTPTITSGGGTPTTVSATGRFKTLGKTVFCEVDVTVTSIGTAIGAIVATLPVNAAAFTYVGAARDHAVDGRGGNCSVSAADVTRLMISPANELQNYWANGRIVAATITYEAA